jgi:hypothetical protein
VQARRRHAHRQPTKERERIHVHGKGAIAVRALEQDAHEPVRLSEEPLLREGWTKHVAHKRLTADDIQRPSLRRAVKREAIERRAQRLVVSERFWRERRETLMPLPSCGRRLARYSPCGEASLGGVAPLIALLAPVALVARVAREHASTPEGFLDASDRVL